MTGISVAEFCDRYPEIWHMAEDGTWPSIKQHGLRSTSSLLDLYAINGAERERLESARRDKSVTLSADGLPVTVLRDQGPLHEPTLAKVLLDGLMPADLYRMLNERVFFWVSETRLDGLLRARRYRDRPHTILTADTSELLSRHGDEVTLTPMNTGNTMMIAMPRGTKTFAPLSEYPFHERRRSGKVPVVELAVMGQVPTVEEVLTRVERRQAGKPTATLWP